MKDTLQQAVQEKRQNLIEKLIKLGVYKINNKHLYEGSLAELEKEYMEIHSCEVVTS
ncbi:Fur-regulated basic protein FbpA [Bacillus rubiinfantis]|uniref:Fur-regulated basic protein FbpA n=1 Tax=Bacillus rubiinfantis TaxID=1499680 RepID=UPI0009E260F6|nr:Fur-regulated basic protein FbpA [Bacillus rubiinfantis]